MNQVALFALLAVVPLLIVVLGVTIVLPAVSRVLGILTSEKEEKGDDYSPMTR